MTKKKQPAQSESAIPEIDDVDMVFGNADKFLPKWDDLPDEFRKSWSGNANPFCSAASDLFYSGGKIGADHGVRWRDSMGPEDRARAVRLTRALLSSFSSKHEHKIAGVGFLFFQWMDAERSTS